MGYTANKDFTSIKASRSSLSTGTTSNISINLLRNDSTYTIDRSPPNVVQNFLSESVITKNRWSFNVTWETAIQNITYILCWYFFSTALSFYNKHLMGRDYFNLNLPIFVSALHSGMHFLITFAMMKGYLSFIYKKPEEKFVSSNNYLNRVVPCALGAAFEICMANASLVLEQPRMILVFIISIISIGVVMTVFGETQFNLIGFLLVLGASIISGLRWSITQMLLQKEEAMNSPFATLYYLSPIMFCAMLLLSFLFESPIAVFNTSSHFSDFITGIQTIGLMFVGGFLAFCMTIAEFALIKNTSTVTLSVAGISKEVVIISLSVFIDNDKLTPLNLFGEPLDLRSQYE
ncbi:9763_t:CDS:2 [Diversispora eburnea]|uniref:9763_t:CDS:1 n=1 Tax=Diversispora eburnea TaxID=1213867 RepID=A0A9N8WBR3_9GLOM|nr:9763_t:CDS:2 [Diversispora eburnea]